MDDLAALAGVSRRTLFNYFPGKDDAVLGGPPVLDAEAASTTFVAGGPHGNLVDDLAEIVRQHPARAPREPARTSRAAARRCRPTRG